MNNTTSVNQPAAIDNDTMGAVIFIIVVLLWYSSSIVFLLGMQIGTSAERTEDSAENPVKLSVQGLRDQSHTKEILSKVI
jgi:hypothetical protein